MLKVAIFIYVTVNMAMVLSLLSIVGSPLPIMSYGGSSMLATMLGLSIVMNSKIYSREQFSLFLKFFSKIHEISNHFRP